MVSKVISRKFQLFAVQKKNPADHKIKRADHFPESLFPLLATQNKNPADHKIELQWSADHFPVILPETANQIREKIGNPISDQLNFLPK